MKEHGIDLADGKRVKVEILRFMIDGKMSALWNFFWIFSFLVVLDNKYLSYFYTRLADGHRADSFCKVDKCKLRAILIIVILSEFWCICKSTDLN